MKKILKLADLAKIDCSASPKVRSEIREDTVQEYAENYSGMVRMPEPVLFEDSAGHYLIGDGWHRLAAMKRQDGKGNTSWVFDIQKGDYADCLRYALQANLRHGLRRSNADKRASVISALAHFFEESNESVATMASVGATLVKEVRQEMEVADEIPVSKSRKGKDGKTYVRSTKSGPAKVKKLKNIEESKEKETDRAVPDSPRESSKDTAQADQWDDTGYLIPEEIKPIWSRREEVEFLMSELSRIKCHIEKSLKAGDPLYIEVSNSVIADLKMVREAVSYALPYSVCPTCNGKNHEKCTFCRGRGVVSEIRYQMVSESLREIREKVCKK